MKKGDLNESTQKTHHDFFKKLEHKEGDHWAEIESPADRRDHSAENVEVGIGVEADETHHWVISESRKP